ncbi:MAG: DNA repair protein RadC [Lachnospiraceae bacterium]|nr:DNA repair protein RadC [Lachnospiraceae bacterium]
MEKETVTIKDLPECERPYEKCRNLGPGALSDAELLAVILRTGKRGVSSKALAQRILDHNGRGILGLAGISLDELLRFEGVGKVKALQILCIGELSKRIAGAKALEKLDFRDPRSIADYYMESMRHCKSEHLMAVFLDTKLKRIGEQVISVGTVNSAIISPREIFIEALKRDAVNLVLLHNHPSGDPTPSNGDINATQRFAKACDYVGIRLLDHVIIGDNCHVSMKSEGLI